MSKIYIRKGDTVYVLAGEDKGKTGRVLEVQRTKATKPTAQYPQGGLVKKEAPIHISNLNLVDPKTGKPTRIAKKRVDGKVVRISKKSNQEI